MTENTNGNYVAIDKEWIEQKIESWSKVQLAHRFPNEAWIRADEAINELRELLAFHSQPLSVFEQKAFEAGRETEAVVKDGLIKGYKDKYESFEDYTAALELMNDK